MCKLLLLTVSYIFLVSLWDYIDGVIATFLDKFLEGTLELVVLHCVVDGLNTKSCCIILCSIILHYVKDFFP